MHFHYLEFPSFSLQAQEIANLRIFHYSGCLNFASHDNFKKTLYRLVGFEVASEDKKGFPGDEIKCVIVDLSCLTYVDAAGVKTLRIVVEEMQKTGIEVLLATAAPQIFEQLKNYEVHESSSTKFKMFPTIHDAVQVAYQRDIPISVSYQTLPCE